ncbi:MAG: pur operon repressor [Epulopiscium sp.]|nr:pur operon repressor [Candidatus Epulonipiscium sp.]
MSRIHKNERIGAIIHILTEHPKKMFTLNYFGELFGCAKSTLSEDLDAVRNIFQRFDLGVVETIAGAAGGVFYIPTVIQKEIQDFSQVLCEKINQKERIIPGGYIYTNDLLYDPEIAYQIGKMMAMPFHEETIDYVVTIETKGIPVAFMVARVLNKPMIVVRKSSRLTEGTAIHMNYITGSTKRIQTMSLAKRAIGKGSKILFIDDFMKAGGTAKGIEDLMKEFESEVIGTGVLMATAEPQKKLVNNYHTLLVLEKVDEETGQIDIRPVSL